MKNKSLLSLLVFSSLILPTMVNAGLVNERVKLQGNLSIKGSETITIAKGSSKGIQLNRGLVDIQMETLENPISMLMPRLYIEQNGQTLSIKVPPSKYLNADEFELSADSSGLNYDILMEKEISNSDSFQKTEDQGCTYYKNDSSRIQFGVQKVLNTYVDVKETYKLTLSKDKVVGAKITSTKSHMEKLHTKLIDICK
ncbi:hypothetical protein SHI21_02705 [Bacteriovorax sp. PP10]|uniref:Uncharacterized protein n=1 Tax=Bacteriovorax antarcticus TaxID=3088717 RepID=A0ABU5VPX3_9BACT|nr:hypothetical protein [Bacteriovorax sp. PP10]MEA9355090.1 hypothetical protein [Bacteriovorax sp. PP10]